MSAQLIRIYRKYMLLQQEQIDLYMITYLIHYSVFLSSGDVVHHVQDSQLCI